MKVGILGATGAVGRQMLASIEERNIEVDEIRLFASLKSAGKKFAYKDTYIEVEEVNNHSFDGLDYVLGAVSNSLSKEYYPLIHKANAIYIDNSSAFRLDKDVPLVVPEINGEDALNHHGIIANPNCSTIISLMALAPIAKLTKIKKITATTFQAVSGAGIQGLNELREEIDAIANQREFTPSVFPDQIAYNVIAEIGSYTENGYTTEEMKMQNEGRKILHLDDLNVSCTCVRVPVFRSHSISLSIITDRQLSIAEAEDAISHFSGDVLVKDHVPTPLETSNQDSVFVGRIRKSLCNENGLLLWCCGDQIRKGAASNAVQIMQYLENHKGAVKK